MPRNAQGIRQGRFRPKNPRKYKGDPTKIFYRSGLELKVMKRLDSDDNVLQWSSEEIVIPYRSPIDSKMHRYFPDFWVKVRRADGTIHEQLIEVKPLSQTKAPRKGNNRQRFISEAMTYGVNLAKWEAAEIYCAKHGMTFLKLTEKDILD